MNNEIVAMKLKLLPSSSRSLAVAVLCDSNYKYNYNYNASSSSSSSSSCCYVKKRHSMIVYSSKSSKKNDSSNSQPTPPPPPPRITSNAKQNLRFLKIWKEYQKRKSSTPRPSTRYRKKKAEKEDLADDQTHLYRDPTTSLYRTNHQLGGLIDNAAAVPVLLVDGYNVCGYWLKLKKHFLNGKLELARQKLIDELITFSILREVKVVVVFDAMMSGFPNHKEYSSGIDVVFSADASADTWIEKEVSALKEDGCPKVWVVTSDHCQQQAAHGAGAFVWSSKALVTEIKASQKEVEDMLQEQRSTSFQGRLLKHNLDAEVVDALKNLRQKLSDNELK
ncbi:hypothetical protein MtrunA17_Chr4g0076721 [Medicago truncatula]|uniref:YacP-like NYN domain protein n=2 Tax=Medicago truncatula TaxID=3880 RepID=A0A072V3J1_MEDTR|nr:uncharacterized protein LOC25494355 isoform X1 [Medicago truncatula]KEH32730.1 YacP-like NYN domain protein [Medicago truncatula]RHN65141.1 hypothetical protein MtrunA17_Chr4g0076721 [Medicago truncatula]